MITKDTYRDDMVRTLFLFNSTAVYVNGASSVRVSRLRIHLQVQRHSIADFNATPASSAAPEELLCCLAHCVAGDRECKSHVKVLLSEGEDTHKEL